MGKFSNLAKALEWSHIWSIDFFFSNKEKQKFCEIMVAWKHKECDFKTTLTLMLNPRKLSYALTFSGTF